MNLRTLVAGCILTVSLPIAAKEATLEKLWETEAEFKVPESVLYDAEREVLYISNIEGTEPWGEDGAGSIGKLSLDGEIIEVDWVDGLDAPKGMGMIGNRLYVTDIHDVVTIDIEKGEIVERFTVPDAGTINDLSVAEDGTIYVTDSTKGIVYKFINGKLSKVIEGRTRLNGVLHSEGELLFVDDGALYLVGEDGTASEIASGMEGHTDGIERVDDDSWLVSCWQGTVYYVTREGEVTLLLDRRSTETSAADLGYDPVNRIAYFPGFWANTVSAYRLKIEE